MAPADVSVNGNDNDDMLFDVLIDEDRIPPGEGNNLKQALKQYGSIVIRVMDGTIDRNAVQMFYNSVSKNVSVRPEITFIKSYKKVTTLKG